jgi:hypothetical protein
VRYLGPTTSAKGIHTANLGAAALKMEVFYVYAEFLTDRILELCPQLGIMEFSPQLAPNVAMITTFLHKNWSLLGQCKRIFGISIDMEIYWVIGTCASTVTKKIPTCMLYYSVNG